MRLTYFTSARYSLFTQLRGSADRASPNSTRR